MTPAISPDLPASVCYLVVFLIALLVARANVNRVLGDYPGHWGMLSNWGLFWAHVALPISLFWFLDYTSALRDTSVFAALIVAFG